MTLISDCCGMPAGEFFDVGICPACREHCEWIDDEETEDEDKDGETPKSL